MPKIELVKSPENCCGCGACSIVCCVQAISMRPSADGCKYPVIDEECCIQCGKCIAVCKEISALSKNQPMEAYAAVGRCEEMVKSSASGGIFATLAQKQLEDEAWIAGAIMDCNAEDVEVRHLLSKRFEDLPRMQGSKYAQSDAWKCYQDVLKVLSAGERVLFSGTPCQVAAVKKLSGDPDNLVTIDLICHGVPPVQMLSEYIKLISKKFGIKIKQIIFRDKTCAKNFCARMEVVCNKKKKNCFLSSSYFSYYKYFLKGTIYRESCYNCPYAQMERTSDITIGDYWGIAEKHKKDFESGKIEKRRDWSCLLLNTQKGKDYLMQYQHALQLIPSCTEWIAEGNRQLVAPSQKAGDRQQILQLYQNEGYQAIEDAFARASGGKLRFYWRALKNMYINNKRANKA